MPDDHSELVPLLPIPNRTVKRLSADDSADSRVKVGHRQASTASKSPALTCWAFCFCASAFPRTLSPSGSISPSASRYSSRSSQLPLYTPPTSARALLLGTDQDIKDTDGQTQVRYT